MIRSDADAVAVLREIHRIVLSVYPIPDDVMIDPAVAFVLGQIAGLAASILKRLPAEGETRQ
jgi:hypothetical protein